MKRWMMLWSTAFMLLGCTQSQNDRGPLEREGDSKLAWAKCIFELDKVEAVRGRNLDDLNKGYGIARNQLMVDCMAALSAKLLPEHFDDMTRYTSLSAKRDAGDLSLNNGTR